MTPRVPLDFTRCIRRRRLCPGPRHGQRGEGFGLERGELVGDRLHLGSRLGHLLRDG